MADARGGEAKRYQSGSLKVEVYPTREAAGAAAAHEAARALEEAKGGEIPVIFATGASQLAMLGVLTSLPGLPWERVVGFHLDEYVGLSPDHPASFRGYLRKQLSELVPMRAFNEIDGTAKDLDAECARYSALLRKASPGLCLLGIGENGHLAFNDPSEANFEDPKDIKVVHLDEQCRRQQVAEGWFPEMASVPTRALSVTIPAIYRVPRLILSVPGKRKAAILRRTLDEPISTACPATILRRHPNAVIYADAESGAELDGKHLISA